VKHRLSDELYDSAFLECAAYWKAFHSLGLQNQVTGVHPEELTELHGKLFLQGALSPATNQLGATLNVEKSIGSFKRGSQSEALANAIREGKTSFGSPSTIVFLAEPYWRELMQAGGADLAQAQNIRLMEHANKQTAQRSRALRSARWLQFTLDIRPYMVRSLADSGPFIEAAKHADVTPLQLASTCIDTIHRMPLATYENESQRIKGVTQAIHEASKGKLNSDQLRRLSVVADLSFNDISTKFGYSSGAVQVKAVFSPEIEAEVRNWNKVFESLPAKN
jgi:hypothetical protein